jgi:ubiquinone/menaquinone biosynthesis C-methylase UbiE
MVDSVAHEAARRGLTHVRAERMDAEALAFPDRSFDAVFCGLGLMYVPDPGVALREMARVLKPGGRASVAVWGARDRCGWAEIFPIVDRQVASEVCPMFFQLGTDDTLEIVMEGAGFRQIDAKRLPTVLHYASEEEACGAAFAGGPVALAYSRFDDKTREQVHAEYLQSLASWRRGAAYDVPGEFVVGLGFV